MARNTPFCKCINGGTGRGTVQNNGWSPSARTLYFCENKSLTPFMKEDILYNQSSIMWLVGPLENDKLVQHYPGFWSAGQHC